MDVIKRQFSNGVPQDGKRLVPDACGRIVWGNGVISMVFDVTEGRPVTLAGLSGRGMEPADAMLQGEPDAQPIVEVRSSRTSGADNRLKLAHSAAGLELRFDGAYQYDPDDSAHVGQYRLAIVQRDERENLTVVSIFDAFKYISAVRCFTVVHCDEPYPLEAVSSFNVTLPIAEAGLSAQDARIFWADSSWDLENQWHSAPLRDTTLGDRNQRINPGCSSARFARRGTSTWSTGEYLPCGIVEVGGGLEERKEACEAETATGAVPAADGGVAQTDNLEAAALETPVKREPFSFMWQVENNGPWEWEIGEDDPGLRVSAYGPEYEDHQWFTTLGPGRDFVTATATFAICAGDWQQAVAEMTMKRRAMREVKAFELGRSEQMAIGHTQVIYNDYMNTLFGDPTAEKELPLIDGAAKVGADVFCIDAGWYDSTDGGWWDTVGEWLPSTNRFGEIRFAGLVHDIQSHGLAVGLWLEPEVIGVNSPMADALPDSAFFQRHGERVADQGRYHLDFRSPDARDYVTGVVERLIDEFGVRYFKFDYNTTPGAGTDYRAESAGAGLLGHCRAYQDWLDALRRAHPDVMIENCGSGAMRADYAMLTRLDLQSTSDQCDPVVYAAIAAGAGMSVLPEQQGNWGYAQPDMDDETAVFTLTAGILGRLYLSGFIGKMDGQRLALVTEAVTLHRAVLDQQLHLMPWWPAGLPSFRDGWLAYGLRRDLTISDDMWPQEAEELRQGNLDDYLAVWRREGDASFEMELPEGAEISQIFPAPGAGSNAPQAPAWRIERLGGGRVRFTAATTEEPSARIFRVRYAR